jgi:Mor family transcriptional regulator
MTEPDLITDILQRISAAAKLPAKLVQRIEQEAREYWGGDRCYIAKAGESPRRREASERAALILAEHRRGDHVPLLARRHQISERHVRRILGLLDATQEPASNDDTAPPQQTDIRLP